MMYPVKKLDGDKLTKIQNLENKMNVCIVAFDQVPQLAEVKEKQLEELKALEKETGSVLVAYKCK